MKSPFLLRTLTFFISTAFTLGICFGDFVAKWNLPVEPFQIADNVYYVGTNYLASYLVTTPQGSILINPDFEESVPLI